jgi:hypothetical protein
MAGIVGQHLPVKRFRLLAVSALMVPGRLLKQLGGGCHAGRSRRFISEQTLIPAHGREFFEQKATEETEATAANFRRAYMIVGNLRFAICDLNIAIIQFPLFPLLSPVQLVDIFVAA